MYLRLAAPQLQTIDNEVPSPTPPTSPSAASSALSLLFSVFFPIAAFVCCVWVCLRVDDVESNCGGFRDGACV